MCCHKAGWMPSWMPSVYLQSVIDQGQDILDRLLLGYVSHQVQKGLGTLSTLEEDKIS